MNTSLRPGSLSPSIAGFSVASLLFKTGAAPRLPHDIRVKLNFHNTLVSIYNINNYINYPLAEVLMGN